MTNIATALKQEIARVARKEIRGEVAPLRTSLAKYRTEIAALKRQIHQLELRTARSLKAARATGEEVASEEEAPALRFRAAGFAKLRQKLGLSAADMGKLLGVSPLSVYNWEQEKAHPRAAQLQAIAAIRKIGKKEAMAKLASTEPQESS